MEKVPGLGRSDEQMELPPGFRFHPTDEELITHYLSPKVVDCYFSAIAIGEVDLNKVEPWDLPWRAKMGEREWYFFCVKDRKYPTGQRTNRATETGYWKATGKDREIYRDKIIVGMKKTLVFYRGRAPKGEKTNWVMHEYRLDAKHSLHKLTKTSKNEWVICRIFRKSSGGKKMHISGLVRDLEQGPNLPPLMDCSACDHDQRRSMGSDPSHVTCLSDGKKPKQDPFIILNNPLLPSFSSVSDSFFPSNSKFAHFHYPDSALVPDESILRFLLHNNGPNTKPEFSPETGVSTDLSSAAASNHEMGWRSYEDQEERISSAPPVDLDCFWTY